MSDVINFSCPQCHSETFKTRAPVKSLDDFNGAVCAQCGKTVSENDVKNHAAEIAKKLILDKLKKLR